MKEDCSIRIRKAMNLRGMKQVDLVEKTGIKKSALSQYLSGKILPKQDRLTALAKALNVSEVWLMGYDVSMEREVNKKPTIKNNLSEILDIIPIVNVDIPVIGDIQCGNPHEAIENAKMKTFQLIEDLDVDFALRCKGDSMINDGINEDDYIFIKEQPTVKNGEISVIIIDNEATLKRFYYYEDKKMVILKAGNPTFEDIIYTNEELDNIRIVGKVVKVLKNVQ